MATRRESLSPCTSEMLEDAVGAPAELGEFKGSPVRELRRSLGDGERESGQLVIVSSAPLGQLVIGSTLLSSHNAANRPSKSCY
jgi:hypothetical protein